ncbi:ABC transporter substrate-binding protein [Staphylococcus felis]|uniref:ABC transporter substrate-binding protein n=1 Tax=Staphylococcus felis TaxID=46127 RepID=A0AAX1RSW1_9STAP|nr:ABC transporter substrate-binding protein [Staphylococcus felis]MBH9580856.1 ABC transporter substrate-binding protein [Staphylococcus felis]MDM8328083.1 ABC transporter substrate-binding protein [Staphylococcus felis]REH78961.1 ABC transporter substrate-binding protein [Staphylococcus felis]REH81870.1 ABC transporter substrate-binding protein [Staphylococcus felis]REH85735.1 ABC transporter substrate-binding protein [Staphylococcus felis]
MKIRQFGIIVLMTMIILAGCNFKGEQPGDTKESSDKDPQRIISLMPSNTEILYELGLGDAVIGVSTVDDYPKEVKDKMQFDAMNLDKEALIKAQPDLILAHETQKASQGKVLESLEKSGIHVEYVKDAQSIHEMYDTFEDIGQLTGEEKEADALVKETQKHIKAVVEEIPQAQTKPSVFIEVSSEPEIYTVGNHTFLNDMLKQLKSKNVFSDVDNWPKVSKEQVIQKNPDVMVSISGTSNKEYQKEVEERSGFEVVNAVKNQRVVAVNDDLLSRPGPRLDDGLKKLRDAIYEK